MAATTRRGPHGPLAHAGETTEVDVGDILDLGFNTPEEYEAARRRTAAGA